MARYVRGIVFEGEEELRSQSNASVPSESGAPASLESSALVPQESDALVPFESSAPAASNPTPSAGDMDPIVVGESVPASSTSSQAMIEAPQPVPSTQVKTTTPDSTSMIDFS
ncbi:hypothetical protein LOK49_LG14G00976 [Camellia lanceoleosa]|uniref:Uncharacterized protein n=1 Tax=Camellia lanceoleosa TaxID=1840588 RepID=A0ACC0FDU8_9ERIC|nr:hypothetical protein LOK49_LG14G00976 [Camellia lanceoleosa]